MAKKRNWIGVLILLLLLVIFPLMSYFYMKAGFDYQVNARDELSDLGMTPPMPEQTFWGDTLTGKNKGKQVSLLSYFDPSDAQVMATSGKYFSEIHQQFDDVEWFRMEFMVPEQAKSSLQDYQRDQKMADAEQVFFYATNSSRAQVNAALYVSEALQAKVNVVALADTSGMIRQFYDLEDGKQFVRLIEHIAMMRPQEEDEREEAVFQREREL